MSDMSSPTLRRSFRSVAPIDGGRCSKCIKPIGYFSPQAGTDDWDQNRCPDCFHYNDAGYVWQIHGGDAMRNNNYQCLCLCECIDTDDPNDADVDMSSDTEEPEDDETTRIHPPIEAIVTSRYGWRANVILNEDTEHERVIFEESIGHFVAAASHDPDIAAESSIANGSNRIGGVEVHDLQESLQPWEAGNIIHSDPTRNWQDLQAIFPEMQDMGRNNPRPSPATHLFCQSCDRPFSNALHLWLALGNITICQNCGIHERPADPRDDPDWYEFSIGDPDAADHCVCRCECQMASSESSNGDIVMEEDGGTPAYDPSMSSLNSGRRSPMILPPLRFLGRDVFVRGDQTHDQYATYVGEFFGLDSIRLSTEEDEEVAMQVNVQLALEDCLSAAEQGEYDQAVRHAQLGLQIGRYMLHLSHQHHLMHALLDATERLAQLGADTWDNRFYRRSVDSLTEDSSPPRSLEEGNNPWHPTGQEN